MSSKTIISTHPSRRRLLLGAAAATVGLRLVMVTATEAASLSSCGTVKVTCRSESAAVIVTL